MKWSNTTFSVFLGASSLIGITGFLLTKDRGGVISLLFFLMGQVALAVLMTWLVLRPARKLFWLQLILSLPLFLSTLFVLTKVTISYTSRPLGSPPIGYENRLKYNGSKIFSTTKFDNIPVDLWFGMAEGHHDTTHFRLASDYIAFLPTHHGDNVEFSVVWPSLRSISEEREIRKRQGLPDIIMSRDVFRMSFLEIKENRGIEYWNSVPVSRCEPMLRDEARGIRYCNENNLNDVPNKRWTNYWALDDAARTPYYNNPVRFGCYVVDRSNGTRYNHCTSEFDYNHDVHVVVFTNEALAVEMLPHFPKLTQFIQSLEVKP
jgi:hypothetical protein